MTPPEVQVPWLTWQVRGDADVVRNLLVPIGNRKK
jgi:hypothetical protein